MLRIGLVIVGLDRLAPGAHPKEAGPTQARSSAPFRRLLNCRFLSTQIGSQIEKRSPFDDVSDEGLELLEQHLAESMPKQSSDLSLWPVKSLSRKMRCP